MLSVRHLSGGYGGASILKAISFQVNKGEMFGVLGPNGSGKTTLLKMISGVLPYTEGEIVVKECSLTSYSQKQLAKIIAVLPQQSAQAFSFNVKETVSLGRYAYQTGWFRRWSTKDESMVQNAMAQTGIADLQDKDIQELSGGERQRVLLAQTIAQEPEILLLDEPTNHLDLSYQKELLDLLRQWTRSNNLTVVSIFHDLNLAGLYCDRLLLLEDGSINVQHIPDEVLQEERIQAVYNTEIKKQPHPKLSAPQMVLLPKQREDEGIEIHINPSMLDISEKQIVLRAPQPLRTMSSGVIGAGTGWYQTFLNRHVDLAYNCRNYREDMVTYLKKQGFEPRNTVGMMTAVTLTDVSYRLVHSEDFSAFVVVTAGVGNAVDASKSDLHTLHSHPGTINIWIFVNGNLTEEAFIQSMMTATEAKVKVLHEQHVTDPITGTSATGTSTDSILIAATQVGKEIELAGPITPLGKLVGKAVYECTTKAIQNYQTRNES